MAKMYQCWYNSTFCMAHVKCIKLHICTAAVWVRCENGILQMNMSHTKHHRYRFVLFPGVNLALYSIACIYIILNVFLLLVPHNIIHDTRCLYDIPMLRVQNYGYVRYTSVYRMPSNTVGSHVLLFLHEQTWFESSDIFPVFIFCSYFTNVVWHNSLIQTKTGNDVQHASYVFGYWSRCWWECRPSLKGVKI